MECVCIQREDREREYQKMSVVGRLAYRVSGVQSITEVVWSSRVEAIITEMRVCTVSMNQWATNEEKMRRNVVSFRNSQDKVNSTVSNLL